MMSLDQPSFLLFVAFSLVAFRLTSAARRWLSLLGLSLLFYLTFRAPVLIVILVAESCIAWFAARAADRTEDDTLRWRWFILGAGGLVAMLVAVKTVSTPAFLPAWWPSPARLGTAIGVSYYSLQAISYVADVYLGRIPAEPSLGKVMAYLAFFPKLIQGPIERASSLLPQLESPRLPGYGELRSAAFLIGGGLFKKVVLGDRLAQIVNPAFADPAQFGGVATVMAVYAYSFQLYFDFSGYTDMARGLARLMGIELSENFRAPYLASSISEFWRRWHITFSRWLLDYVFTPLQAMWRRSPVAGTAAALFLTFTLSGAWHGFTGPFLAWGLLHGTYLAVESIWRKRRRGGDPTVAGRHRVWRMVLTFHLVVLAWVFFRAPTLEVAGRVLRSIVEPRGGLVHLVMAGGGWQRLAITLGSCGAFAAFAATRHRPALQRLGRHAPVRWAFYYAVVVAIMLLRLGSSGFIYAQF